MFENDFDIVAVTETWLTSSMSNSEINVAGYTLFRKDRGSVKNLKGGGVLIYVKECLCAFEVEKLNNINCESIWIKLQTSKQNAITVGLCYRSQKLEEEEIKTCLQR